MALKTSLRFLARKISEAVASAASNQGLSMDDYDLAGNYSEESEHVYLKFRTTKSIDDLKLYTDVFQEIRRLIPDTPSVTSFIGLVIRDKLTDADAESFGVLPEGDEDITDLLIRR
jgi:hypothetical protein